MFDRSPLSLKLSAVTHRNLNRIMLSMVLGVLFLVYFSAFAQSEKLERLRIWHSPDSTRIVFDVSSRTEYKTFLLENPKRLVVDLDKLDLSVALPEVQEGNQHLSGIRSGQPTSNVLRVVFDLKKPIKLESFVLTPNELYGHRLVIDLLNEDQTQANEEPTQNVGSSSGTSKAEDAGSTQDNSKNLATSKSPLKPAQPVPVATSAQKSGPFTVAIDACLLYTSPSPRD